MEHEVKDDDIVYIIDKKTRQITGEEFTVMQFDHNSERVTFEAPRFIENHDMSLCSKVEIHYVNANSNGTKQKKGVYEVEDLTLKDDETVTFSWLISQNATTHAGTLHFLIRFVCVTDDVIDYAWNTGIFTGLTVKSGMNNGEAVATEYADVLAQWKKKLEDLAGSGGGDGFSPTAKVEETDAGAIITLIDKNGATTATIIHGYTPEKGVDYFTDEDIYEITQFVIEALPKYNGEVESV